MPIDLNQTQICAYTVPAESLLIIKRVRVSISRANGSNGSAQVSMRIRSPDGVFRARRNFEVQTGAPTEFSYYGGERVEAGSDIIFKIENVSDANTSVEAAIEFVTISS